MMQTTPGDYSISADDFEGLTEDDLSEIRAQAKQMRERRARPGLHHKYTVTRNDGRDEPGQKHADCWYFVLDVTHDPFALPALEAYAAACEIEHPQLAFDLRDKAHDQILSEQGRGEEQQ